MQEFAGGLRGRSPGAGNDGGQWAPQLLSTWDNGRAPRGGRRHDKHQSARRTPDGERHRDRGGPGPSRGHPGSRGASRPGADVAASHRGGGSGRSLRAGRRAGPADPWPGRPRDRFLGQGRQAHGVGAAHLRARCRPAGLRRPARRGRGAGLRPQSGRGHPAQRGRALPGRAGHGDRPHPRPPGGGRGPALLALPPVQRALVESAAQGRFPYSGPQRPENAGVLAGMLDELVPFGGPESAQLRGLAALDALALADEGERARLRELTAGSEAAAVHRHAIEAAARLTLLTALPPTRDLHADVLDPLEGGPSAGPEAAYHGTYATPVLGTDTQRRMVGPPAMAGGPQTGRAGAATPAPAAPRSDPRATSAHPGTAPAPVFSFRPSDEAGRTRRQRRRQARAARPARGAPWLARSVAALALVAVLVLAWVVIDTRAELASSREAAATWSALSTDPEAQLVRGLSDNGTWRAVLTDDGLALRAEGVDGYDGEVLQLWGESDGAVSDLGVLELSADGLITHSSSETAERLLVTRENAPQNRSGTPSARVVANLDPGLPGG